MAVSEEQIQAIFEEHLNAAQEFLRTAEQHIEEGFKTFEDSSAFSYEPYDWQIASPPIIGGVPTPHTPSKPGFSAPGDSPDLKDFPEIADPDYGTPGDFNKSAPNMMYPTKPGSPPSDNTGSSPTIYSPQFPPVPSMVPLPSTALPYPFITIPPAPPITMPTFDGTKPSDIQQISLPEYMNMLTQTYAKYSQEIPNLVRANWQAWFTAYIGQRPLLIKIANTISWYLDNGGSGIPVPIEEAIVTRNTDRVVAEQRRATMSVYDSAVKRGLLLPSGALLAGLKEARQVAAEAVSKVATDVAIKNMELEHKHMEFMMQLGNELEKWIAGFATDTAKIVLECNNQAIEVTKFVLTGMIEINNTMVKIYLAQWEAYKAAVEVYKARIAAVEAQVRIFEAQIKAEMAKVEINKSYVEMLHVVANTNKAIAEMYKSLVDAESAKVETSRTAVMAFEAQVHAYAARVEAWKAQWIGYTSAIEGETAKMKAYEAEVNAFAARTNAYKAEVEGYAAKVHGQAEQIKAIGAMNETNLRAWSTQAELGLKQYVAETEAYKVEWSAVGEQMKAGAESTRVIADSLYKGYEMTLRIDTERAREHLAEWRSSLEARIAAARGMVEASHVAGAIAQSALNGITTFAGAMTQGGGTA